MVSKTQQVRQQPQDRQLWQKLYYKHQQEYIRKKLNAIKALWDGNSRSEVVQQQGCSYRTLSRWIDQYLEAGVERLVQPISHQVAGRLAPEQQQELRHMVLEQSPRDYGIEQPIWTGAMLSQVIAQRWQVNLKDSRIYEILDCLGLSYQKGHRDYANADPKLQQAFVDGMKKNWRIALATKR